MREKQQKQMPLMESTSNHIQERELEVISNIIDSTPTICEHVMQDSTKAKLSSVEPGLAA